MVHGARIAQMTERFRHRRAHEGYGIVQHLDQRLHRAPVTELD